MKYYNILVILLFSSVISFYSCNEKPEPQKQETLRPFVAPTQQNTSTQNSASQNAGGVYHYTCNRGCAGGAGAAGNCATCGDPLAHNQAFHTNTNNTPTTTPNTPATAEASQNAAGVWHYTCGQGCAGGSGSAVACANCGNTLAHNTAYHQ